MNKLSSAANKGVQILENLLKPRPRPHSDTLCGVFEEVLHPTDLGPEAELYPHIQQKLKTDPGYAKFYRSGVMTHRLHTPIGYKMKIEKFHRFLLHLLEWADAEKFLILAANERFSDPDSDKKPTPAQFARLASQHKQRLENLVRMRDLKKGAFRTKFGPLADRLWVTLPRTNDAPLGLPFFNPIYFPRTKAGKDAFFQLVNVVSELHGIYKGGSAGAPSESTSLDGSERELVIKMTRKGKGSEKGSARLIASNIAEKRGYSIKKEGQKLPALSKAVQRLRRRRGL